MFDRSKNIIRPALYLAVIGMSMTLPDLWMSVMQAAFGGFGLGAWAMRRFDEIQPA